MTRSPLRIVVTGIAAGLLGAGLNSSVVALMGGDTSAQILLGRMGYGAAWGVLFCLVYPFLPRNFVAQVIAAATATTAVAWIIVMPAKGVPFSAAVAAQSVAANTAYGLMCMFVLHQAHLALPMVNMDRRAEQFSDNPSGA